ncbi:signal peptidase I SipW [Neobacillus sp. K501]
MKAKTIKKVASNIITIILAALLIFMLFIVISSKAAGGEPQVFGYQLKTVLSGSMEPGIKTGSIIAVKLAGETDKLKKGDVITFKMDEQNLATHRIIEVVKSGDQVMYRTKGDNNKTADLDPVLSQNVVAEYKGFTIPYLGYFMNFAQSKNGNLLLLVLPGLMLLAYSALTIWRTMSQVELKVKGSNEKTVNR